MKGVHKPALLKDKILLLCLRLRNHHTTMFPFDLSGIIYMHRRGVCQNRILQGGKVFNLWILIVEGYTLFFNFGCKFSGRGAQTPSLYSHPLQILRLIRKIPSPTHPWGRANDFLFSLFRVIFLLNQDDRICITVQTRLPQRTQVLL